MTVKTVQQLKAVQLKASKSDMQKRGAIKKNLFNSVPDRDELNGQIKQYENESNKALSNFKIESIIGVIESASYQPRKLKRVPRCLEEESDDDTDDESDVTVEEPNNRDISSDEPSSLSSSSSSSSTSTTATASSKQPDVKPMQNKSQLPKGQSTLNDYFPTVKRPRQQNR